MKKTFWTAIAVAIMSLVLALTMGIYLLVTGLNKEERYMLYVGSETYSSQTLIDKTKNICTIYVDGYTVVEGKGGWTETTDGNKKFHSENTIIYYFCDTDKSTVEALATHILQEVPNCAILMETVISDSVHSSTGYFN